MEPIKEPSPESSNQTSRAHKEPELQDVTLKVSDAPAAVGPASTSGSARESNVFFGDKYEVLGMIGQGSMGTVYKVRDRSLGKVLAIKVLKPEFAHDQQSVKRFEQEAMAASQLTHVNLGAVYGHAALSDGTPFMIMDFLDGQSLEDLLKQERALTPARTIDLSLQICDGLVHAHMKGVVHRDLKPANIMISKNEDGIEVVRVIDFGIAKVVPTEGQDVTRMTLAGDFIGTPSYMSPEQCSGQAVDARSDLYSLGCVIYQMLTGNPPFEGSNLMETVLKQVAEITPKFDSRFDIPEPLQAVVFKLLEKNLHDRYQSADEALRDLYIVQSGHRPKIKRKRKPLKVPRLLAFTTIAVTLGMFAVVRDAVQKEPVKAAQLMITLNPPPWVETILLPTELAQGIQSYRIAELLYRQGKFVQAENMLNGMLETSPALSGLVSFELAKIEAAKGDSGAAIELMRKLAGGGDLGTARNLHILGYELGVKARNLSFQHDIAGSKKAFASVLPLSLEAYRLYAKVEGEDSYNAGKELFNSAVYYAGMGNIKEALELAEQASKILAKHQGEDPGLIKDADGLISGLRNAK